MNKTLLLLALFFLGSVSTGCNKKDPSEQAADEAAEAARLATENVSQSATASADVSSKSARKPSEKSVPSGVLKGYLPSVQGFETAEPEAVDMSMNGQAWSSVVQRFNNGEQQVTVSIMDWNFNEGLTAAYSMYTDGNLNIETNDGFTRAEKVNGYPGWINWDKKNNSGTIGTVVNDRFYVITEVRGGASLEDLRRVAASIDMAGIANAK